MNFVLSDGPPWEDRVRPESRLRDLRELADGCNEARFHIEDASEAMNEGDPDRTIELLDQAIAEATHVLSTVKSLRDTLDSERT